MKRALPMLSLAVALAMAVSAVWAGSMLPPDARLPVHWNVHGRADGFAGKWVALALPLGMVCLMTALAVALPRLEPRRDNLARSGGLFQAVWLAWLVVTAVLHLMLLDAALAWGFAGPRWLLAAMGLMLAIIGNQLGKSRRMYTVGIRTPWTLADEDVWIATHRLGGKLFVVAGLLWIAAAVLAATEAALAVVLLGSLLVVVTAPLVYSYLLWRRRHPIAP